ncbi:MAG TPA: universal stress protein [Planctomycetota bacterium]|nr:universal stress protein [Planctomycetota bacterium]
MIEKILVPTDGSPESECAFAAILPLVKAFAPEITVLYVFEDPDASYIPPAQVAKVCRGVRAAGMNAHLELREGKPAQEILLAARAKKVSLIAMSTHGRGGVSRLVRGSVAESVLRRALVPLLVTRPGAHARSWKKIVVALDGSERAESVLPDAFNLAHSLGATLDLVRVAFPMVIPSGAGEVPMLPLPPEDPMPYLKTIVDRAARLGLEAHAFGLEGAACPQILRHVEDSGADLLCLATHGRTGLTRAVTGSIAEEILRKAPCPVLVRRSVIWAEDPPGHPSPRGAEMCGSGAE